MFSLEIGASITDQSELMKLISENHTEIHQSFVQKHMCELFLFIF